MVCVWICSPFSTFLTLTQLNHKPAPAEALILSLCPPPSTAAGPAGSYQNCERVGSRPSATQTASATPGTATPQRRSPWLVLHLNPPAWRSAWTTTSTPVWPGQCPSATATHPCWHTSPGTRASSPGWWPWTPSPRWDNYTESVLLKNKPSSHVSNSYHKTIQKSDSLFCILVSQICPAQFEWRALTEH